MATYSIGDLNRREILKMTAILGFASVASNKFAIAQTALPRTPEQILGPFYPMKTLDQTADLTRVPGRPGRAEGHVLNVMGRVLNLKGEPVRNAKVEVWQANAHGRYTHPSDRNPAPIDPNFEGSSILTADYDGRYRFTTIKPAAYCSVGHGNEPTRMPFNSHRWPCSPTIECHRRAWHNPAASTIRTGHGQEIGKTANISVG